jgi:hypothetical protein
MAWLVPGIQLRVGSRLPIDHGGDAVPTATISSLDSFHFSRHLTAGLPGHDDLSTAFHATKTALQYRADLGGHLGPGKRSC